MVVQLICHFLVQAKYERFSIVAVHIQIEQAGPDSLYPLSLIRV
jgi:hypothetical protein